MAMSGRSQSVPNRRAIIDRRTLADTLAEATGDAANLRRQLVAVLRQAHGQAFLIDQIVRLAFDFTTDRLYRNSNPSGGERIAIAAVGGYGRGEMAPHSDVDIAFLTPWKQTAWAEQVIESLLYTLWDLGLKVGHSSRSLDEMVRQAKADLTIRTAGVAVRLGRRGAVRRSRRALPA
jgi:[protein-PII] uridylyltransferase